MVGLLAAAACGGSVVFVEDDDGAGGSGGKPSSTSTTSPTTTKATSVVGTTSPAVTTSVGVTTGVTTGGQFCEFGEPSPDCDDCIQNTITGACEPLFNDCFSNPDCEQYGTCIGECQENLGCCESCSDAFPPDAVATYNNLLACVFCDACSLECAGVLPGFCGF